MNKFYCKYLVLLEVFLFLGAVAAAQTGAPNDIFPNSLLGKKYAALSPSGKYIIFDEVTKVKKNEERWVVMSSELIDDMWSEPKPVFELDNFANNTGFPIGGFSFNYDGSILYFHAKVEGNYDIYFSNREGDTWGKPKKFDTPVNTFDDEFSPTISVDNNHIFFLRPKPNTDPNNSCKIIMLYSKNKEGKWIGPQFTPQSFNVGCQETPFFCSDDHTLYFSSQRPDTNRVGDDVSDFGYNIYYSKLYSDNLYENYWNSPVYIDEFNTPYDDFSPSMNYTGDYFIKITYPQKETKRQAPKVYNVEVPEQFKQKKISILKGLITDLHSKKPLVARIVVSDAITSAVYGEFSSRADGSYSIFLKENTSYKFDFFDDEFSHTYYLLQTENFTDNEEKVFNVQLYSNVKLQLNVFDNELFYPLSPVVSIFDSQTGELVIDGVKPTELGVYFCNLNIGKQYKIHFDCPNFELHDEMFDLKTDVQYSNFELDVELQAKKKNLILNIDQGDAADTSALGIVVRNLSRNETRTVLTKRDKDGNLVVELREGDVYELDVSKKGYTYYNTKVDVSKEKNTQKLDVKLELLTTETKMSFNNITFEYNSSELTQASYQELDRLVEFMLFNNQISIELSAHTDDVGSDQYNNRLSDKRAQSAMKYLITHGVPETKVIAKGYGESVPLVPNTTDENKAKNRRVEVKIVE